MRESIMGIIERPAPTEIAQLDVDGRRVSVALRVRFDGVEHAGRLWFKDEGDADPAFPDRSSVSGQNEQEALARARLFTLDDLIRRYRRGLAEKRRYTRLRHTTDELLAKIRYLNQVAIAMRAGMLDIEGAAQEIDLTEHQMHELVDLMRGIAGVEE